MKTIGLIGGMSWESSRVYYEVVNHRVKELLGGFHSCQCVLYSVDFAEIEQLQRLDQWDELDSRMVDAARRVERAGADIIVLCTNTMHLSSQAIESNISVPLLHIADCVGLEIVKKGISRVGLLGTLYTMKGELYPSILHQKYGIEVLIPEYSEMERVHRIIYKELVYGLVKGESRQDYKRVIANLAMKGADGVILGCTEIPMLISQEDVDIPIFDTTRIHAEKAVDWALNPTIM